MHRHLIHVRIITALIVISLTAPIALAGHHDWDITEVYSNSSGTVQFVELFTDVNGEPGLAGNSFTSSTNNYTFNHSVTDPTANTWVLIATQGYHDLRAATRPDLPAEDYLIPNNFFATSGSTLTYAGLDGVTFSAGQLPTDGFNSLHRSFNAHVISTGANTPHNFAGNTGQVPEPALLYPLLLCAAAALRRQRTQRN